MDNLLNFKQEINFAVCVYEVVTAENGYKNRDRVTLFAFNKKLQP